MREMTLDAKQFEPSESDSALHVAFNIARRYQLTSIDPLIQSCFSVAEHNELSVAIIGRFKAGKSSFLNSFLEREILPVGVVPVTTVITELAFAPAETATVHFLEGEIEKVALDQVHLFIAESENPGNRKAVSSVVIELPELAPFRTLRFVDMPGLESTFAHNTETARKWLPNVGLALVAVAVDPPLSQHDIALIKALFEYTPKVSILLTKIDLLTEVELQEVLAFVNERLKEAFAATPMVFPYSTRPGFKHLRLAILNDVIEPLLANFRQQRDAVIERKVETLMRECYDYLTLALKSAETVESEREALKQQVLEREVIDDLKTELRLIVRHTAVGTRAGIAKRLDKHRFELEGRLISELDRCFPQWTKSLAFALRSYQEWLDQVLSEELAAISATERTDLLLPLNKLKTQVFRSLQNFRDHLSNKALHALGVPLRTSEQAIELREPHTPDIHIGRVFDHSWELLSAVLPMSFAGPLVRGHFRRKLPFMIEKNLSRLATQWEESIRDAMTQLLTECYRRIDELVATIATLISTSGEDSTRIRKDLKRLQMSAQSESMSVDIK
jgi:GTP-binding protein EngB required for normal cell division